MKKGYKVLAIILAVACMVGNLAVVQAKEKNAARQTVSVEGSEPIEMTEPTETPKMTETPKSSETPEPTEMPKPSETPEPTETPKPSETPEPTNTPRPTETPKPTHTPKPTKKPKPKLKVHLRQKKKRITIRWNKIEDASAYLLYTKSAGNKYKKQVIKKKYSISLKLEYGKTYRIKMAARNKKHKILSRDGSYEIYIPEKVRGIHTTSLGKKKAKLIWTGVRKADRYYIYSKASGQKKYTLLGKRKKNSFVDEKLKYNKNYRYKVVAVAGRDGYTYQGEGGCKLFSNKKLVSTNHQKYTYTEMEKDIKALTKKYYGLVHYRIIGKSEDGRNIYDVIVGNQNASKSMLVVSTLHAREYMASLVCMNQAEYYLQNSQEEIGGKKAAQTLQQIAIHYIPMANPDGVTISQYGISKIRSSALRKKLAKISADGTMLWKANARGVDLNRNFPYHFKKSGKAGSEGYSGKTASSEAETKAVVNLIQTLKQRGLSGVINYHATGSILFGGCTKKGAVQENTQRMYHLAKEITGYADSASYEKKHKGGIGSLREYLVYKQKVPSITLEIGVAACPGPISEFPAIWEKNKTLVLEEAMLFL